MASARVAYCGKFNGVDDVRNVFTINNPTHEIPDTADVADWLTAMYHTSGLMALLSNKLRYDHFVVEVPLSDGKWVYNYEGALAYTGEKTDNYLPQQVAAVVVGITSSRRRGKKFISGITESSAIDGSFITEFQTALQAFGDAYILGIPGGSNPWFSGVCKKDGSEFIEFSAVRVDQLLGTQRRRKPGVGA